MKKSLLIASLSVISANVLGMKSPDQNEQRSSGNVVTIPESSKRNETHIANNKVTTWWSDGLRNGKEGFLKNIKEKRSEINEDEEKRKKRKK